VRKIHFQVPMMGTSLCGVVLEKSRPLENGASLEREGWRSRYRRRFRDSKKDKRAMKAKGPRTAFVPWSVTSHYSSGPAT